VIKAFGKHRAKCVVNYVGDAQGQNRIDAINVANELNDRHRMVEIERSALSTDGLAREAGVRF
jgi:hypothetical protein